MENALNSVLGGAVRGGGVPGVVAMVTTADGSIYEGAFGVRALGQKPEMALDTVFWLASMTKAITATAAMQLVEQGLLELDAPIAKHVPKIAEIQVLDGWGDDGQPVLRAPKRELTLRHLLSHTGGFSYEFWNANIGRLQEALGIPGIGTQERAALMVPLQFDPGEKWEYGVGMDWVGLTVEAVSGMDLEAYFQANVLGPIGMGNTTFRLRPDMYERLAAVHQRDAAGVLEATDFVKPQQPDFLEGGGALYSTAGDYLKFIRVFLNEGRAGDRQILKPETVAMMSASATGDIKVRPMITVLPNLSNDCEFFPGVDKSWSLGFMVNDAPAPTGRSAGSLGWGGLANTYFWIDQTRGIGGVYMTQILPFADHQAVPLFLEFERLVYDDLG
ncbi:MAG: serine hydrolase domain-containing protein [Paracoccaceae bacterium]